LLKCKTLNPAKITFQLFVTFSQIKEATRYLVLAIGVGATTSAMANLFIQGEAIFGLISNFFASVASPQLVEKTYWIQGVALFIGAALILQIRRVFGVTYWSGPAESMFALQFREGPPLNTRIGTGSVLAAFVACGCGAPVGQYGPVIHLGATISQSLRERIRTTLRPDIMLCCGISGAITGAFNAPLASTVFVFEVMLRRFTSPIFAAVVVATTSAYVVNQTFFDHGLFLPLTIHQPTLLTGISVALVAPLCGLVAWFYIRSLQKLQDWNNKLAYSPTVIITACALACALIGGMVPELLGLGRQTMQNMLLGSFDLHLLVVLLVGKVLLTSMCIASGFYGGIVAPALFVGAATGALLAKILFLFGLGDWTPLLLMNAMAGVTAAVIGAPLTLTLLVIELTGAGINGALVVVTAYASTWLTRRYLASSYYQAQLNQILSSPNPSSGKN
jgi:CIC family chloride channel protein